MRQVPRRVLVLPASDLALAAASWGPGCAVSAGASGGSPTIAPTGIPDGLPKSKKRLPPCFPPHPLGGKMPLGLRTAVENP
jgi:hypothetical protein